jgi:hypothetical protein
MARHPCGELYRPDKIRSIDGEAGGLRLLRLRFSVRWVLTATAVAAVIVRFVILPMHRAAQEVVCQANLRTIGLALRNYHGAYGCFPPAYTTDARGTPMHSWRVLILPFAGEDAL